MGKRGRQRGGAHRADAEAPSSAHPPPQTAVDAARSPSPEPEPEPEPQPEPRRPDAEAPAADVRLPERVEPPPARGNGLSAFLLHLHPRAVRRRSAGFRATLGLGLATLTALALATLSGLLLMIHYVPSVERAHASVQDIIAVVPFGRFVRNLHRWAAHAAVLFCALHLLRTFLWGAYRGAHRRVWLLGAALLLVTLATSYSGYLLPWDQDAFWTVTVGTSLASYLPLVGDWLKEFLLGGDRVGQPALLRFYALHVALLPALGLLLLGLHLFRLRRAGGLARPPDAAGAGEDLVPASPRLTSRELGLALLVALVLGALAAAVDARLGPAPDLLRPDDPPKAPWFLVGMQEMVSYSARLGGVLLPGLVALLIALLPWLDGGAASDGAPLASAAARRAVPVSALLGAAGAGLAVVWWGDPQLGALALWNPASIAGAIAAAAALLAALLWRSRALVVQSLLASLLAALLCFTVVGWFWRGPDWKLVYHPGPGPGAPGVVEPARRALDWRKASRAAGADEVPLELRTASGAVDRCPTCHRSVLAVAGARSSHPAVKGHAGLAAVGCSACHGGQGRRLDDGAHQPALGAGLDPFLRRPLLEARCARCHVPGVDGAPALARGIREYLDAGCSGCHQPGRLDQGLGPDLRRLGRRSEAELLRSILEPEIAHLAPVMASLRWRFDDRTREGKQALAALLTALLAFGEDAGAFRSAWARPEVRSDVACEPCHLQAKPPRGAPRHRCRFLRGNASLRCQNCHGGDATRPAAAAATTARTCPQLTAARPTCQVCHGGRR